MITFAPMSPPASSSDLAPRAHSRRAAAMALLALLVAAPLSQARTQSGTGPLDDATPIPRGWLRFGVLNAWTRYDGRFGANGALDPLGAPLSTDSLGPRQ